MNNLTVSITPMVDPSKKYCLSNVPRTDIRRQYPQMLMNIFNGHDPLLVHSFFMTYSLPHLVGSHHLHGATLTEFSRNRLPLPINHRAVSTLFGPEKMALFYGTMLQLNPDQIMRLQGASIHVNLEKSVTKIVCDVQHDFTQLYAVNPMATTDEIVHFLLLYHNYQSSPASASSSLSLSSSSSSSSSSSYANQASQATAPSRATGSEEDDGVHLDGSSSSSNNSGNNGGNSSNGSEIDRPVTSSGEPTTDPTSTSPQDDEQQKPREHELEHEHEHEQHQQQHQEPQRHAPRRMRKTMSRRTRIYDDTQSLVVPNTFQLYQQLKGEHIPVLPTPLSIRIQYQLVVVADPLRRILSVDFQNPEVTVLGTG
jgi:hypothetical protein